MTYKIILLTAAAITLLSTPFPIQGAVVTPNANSLLKNKRILIVEATNWNGSSSHINAKANGLANLNAIKTQVGIASFTVMDNVENMTFNTLNTYDVVVFNYVFNTQLTVGKNFETAFKQWLAAGNKGYVGYHTSGANEATEWPWYRDSVTSMRYHKHTDAAQSGRFYMNRDPSSKSDPILSGMDTSFTGEDEWYSFDLPPKAPAATTWGQCKVIYYMDESSAKLSDPMGTHPMAWYREDDKKNRFFYSAFIHSEAGAKSDFFRSMILRAMEYVSGYAPTSISSHGNSIQTFGTLAYITNSRQLNVSVPGAYRLLIFSSNGKLLNTLTGSGQKTYAPTAFKSPGIYFVKLQSKTKEISQKIMVY